MVLASSSVGEYCCGLVLRHAEADVCRGIPTAATYEPGGGILPVVSPVEIPRLGSHSLP